MSKSKQHSSIKTFKEIIKKLRNEYITPYKHLSKDLRPEVPQKVLDRIERNKRFIRELNELKNPKKDGSTNYMW